jgi:hypothetical protein
MFNKEHKKAQAATELAVFGAILIFLIGTIVRIAVGNSYTQDQNFKAMRMAMLSSWRGSTDPSGNNTSHNQASILVIEDRLSPDFNKYGDLDRNPYVAQGSGSFSYQLLYPITSKYVPDILGNLPIMDIYINGQHFPLTEASYVPGKILSPPTCGFQAGSCAQNQCLRDQRSWIGGIVQENSFAVTTVAPVILTGTAAAQRTVQMQNNACTIFTDLSQAQIFSSGSITTGTTSTGTPNIACTGTEQAGIDPNVTLPPNQADQGVSYSQWMTFVGLYERSFPNPTSSANSAYYGPYLQAVLNILLAGNHKYKLFYEIVANPGPTAGSSQYSLVPPTCTSPSCVGQSLTADLVTMDKNNTPGYWNGPDPNNPSNNHTGDMMFDLQRNADYSANPADASTGTPAGVEAPGPLGFGSPVTTCSAGTTNMRCFVAWQWAASAATSAAAIGIITTTNNFPTYDIDGRLKEVTVFYVSYDPKAPSVTVKYEDPQGGDIDASWDSTTCGPKPGLQSTSQALTYTKDGTYLVINEGKLYNPEQIGTGGGQVVRSANKRDSIDLISRAIQLSNNTGRFCSGGQPLACIANDCAHYPPSTSPNPVTVCVDESSPTSNCFTGQNSLGQIIAQTCYDTNLDVIYVRSRLEDRRGRFWMTNATGQLKVGQ